MNQKQLEQIHCNLSEQAKKVYDCIPIQESWSPVQIMQELHRKKLSTYDYHLVMGCIHLMVEAGIIKEPKKGFFVRENVETKNTVGKQTKPTVVGPIDRLSEFAQRLRQLALDMESAAIDLAGQIEINDAETAKMRQLKELLKSLG